MKKFFASAVTAALFPNLAYANPACPVCTIAIGASLGIAKKIGIEDSIVGLWAGALLALLGYWTIVFFDKRNWHFRGRDFLLMLISVSMIGFIYISEVPYTPVVIWNIFYLDPILFSAVLGVFIFIYSEKLYEWMKCRNGGHAHFPFEKVVLPVVFLFAASLYFTYFPI